jgi:hypothetical protein
MNNFPKPPYRYVPTLTEVVSNDPPDGAQPFGTSSTTSTAEPTATTQPGPGRIAHHSNEAALQSSVPSLAQGALEEEILHRVMQRIDVSLDYRLRKAVSEVMQEQTRQILARLREEVESVVREAVHEAVADELAVDSSIHPRK